MPSCRKEALLDPLPKQSSLDHELFCHYRPISNLMFTSKLCERVLAMQVNDHLNANGLVETFQSAYKVGHSTESTLLHSTDYGKGMLLLTLDLSAAFDTVDHYILLQRLHDRFGIQGAVYRMFESYLEERRQFVSIGKEQSNSRPLTCGVPQGSVLGPLLFSFYTAPLGDIMRTHGVSFHQYTDDTQIYYTFSTSDASDLEQAKLKLEMCLRDINVWMLHNNLQLNDDKTKILVFHAKHRPAPYLDCK